jgi:hypothetical protein
MGSRLPWSALVVVGVIALVGPAPTGDAGATSSTDPVGPAPSVPAVHQSQPQPRPAPTRPQAPAARDVLPVKAGRSRPVVVFYGDSLGWEARYHLAFTLTAAGADVQTRTMGGTALCDFFDAMRLDAATLQPDAVVIEFSGNAMTPCMLGSRLAMAGLEPIDAYRVDAAEVLRIFPTSRVYFVGTPPGAPDKPGWFHGGLFNEMYREVAAAHPSARYVDAGAAVLDHGRFTMTLPCLPGEPCTGGTDPQGRAVNVVRAQDGHHFCPSQAPARPGTVQGCPVWSSGAYRFALAIAKAVAADFPG